ncbi:YktB family protein [Cytobacillus pseudoceanisediminis]|uniref:YktB family protein n=1 Tax=Cytobacillus pseudoceanisediminis TaxID=3051614 RepID=UPI003CF9AC1C
MQFQGFSKNDFETFNIEGLDLRMEAIEERIRPKFREIGQVLTDELSMNLGQEMFLHIAKHARRTVNAPKDTWLAIAGNKRGYKQHPHFQIGLFDDHVFIWLAFIYELPNKEEIAKTFLKNLKTIKTIVPNDFSVSQDHMKKDAISIEEIDLKAALERFRDVKKAELLIGRKIAANDPILTDGNVFMNVVRNTFETLIPLYKLSYK